MFNRADIKERAKAAFLAQYGISIGALVLYWVIAGFTSSIFLGVILVLPPMLVGYTSFCLRVSRNETGDISDMFTVGFGNFGRSIGGILWMELFTFLWSLLFIIPGIVKAMAYSMTPYILADCPNVSPTNALKLSMRMTQGHKGGIFVMYLSFIGWMILSGLTMGILYIVYVGPYIYTSFAGLYNELKAKALMNGVIRAEELA